MTEIRVPVKVEINEESGDAHDYGEIVATEDGLRWIAPSGIVILDASWPLLCIQFAMITPDFGHFIPREAKEKIAKLQTAMVSEQGSEP